MEPNHTFLGLDIGGTNLKVLAFDPAGTVVADQTVPTSDDGTRAWLDRARDTVRELAGHCPGALHIGVAAPGLIARDERSVASMPSRLPGLEGLDWQAWLEAKTPVRVLNDAKAALLGEIWAGAARGINNALLLTLGTGVGGAAMVDGRILHGHLGRAGHLGHISLDPEGDGDIVNTPGSLEDALGECTLRQRSGGAFQDTRELVAAFRNGNAEAAQVWLRSVRALAAGLASLINAFDPEVVVLGGGIADADAALFEPLQQELDRFEWRPGGTRVRLVKSALGRNAGATGAAYGAKQLYESTH